MFPDFSDELGNSAPVAIASRLVEGLDVVGGFGRVGLQQTNEKNMWSVQSSPVQSSEADVMGQGHERSVCMQRLGNAYLQPCRDTEAGANI